MSTPGKQETRIDVVEPKQGVFGFYANGVDAVWTPHDLKIKFRELMRVTEATDTSPKVLTYEERATVTLAWSEAKLAADMLNDIIGRYEKINGEIKIAQIP